MFYKCYDCGHIFEDGEERITSEHLTWLDGVPIYETHYSCPSCGSENYEETQVCVGCNGHFLEDEIFSGWCASCLRDAIDYDSFFEYETDEQSVSSHIDGMAEFVFVKVFRLTADDVPAIGSLEFRRTMQEIYLRQVANEKILGKHEFLDAIRSWIMDDGSEADKEDFAEWLNKKKKGEK